MTSPLDPRERAFDALIRTRIDEGLGHLDGHQPMPEPAPAAAVDVIVPVHDAHDDFARCLASLLVTLDPAHRLVLIDDASTDPRIWPLLQQAAADRANTHIQRHTRNRGYLQTVNAAIAASARDVLLLNSDTVVGPGWLDRLAAAAHDGERAGLACPLSDNATLLSVVAEADISGVDEATLQRLVVASARAVRPRLPVAVGFCLYVRRAVFDAIGVFDAAFDPGYGEESDFSMRALAAGFEIVAATDVLVRHRAGSSFGHGGEIRRRRSLHARIVRQRWPAHDSLIQAWWRDWPLREQAERLRSSLSAGRPRVLQTSHGLQRLGGIELHSRALVASLAREVDVDLLAPEPLPDWADLRDVERGPGWSLRALNRRLQSPNQSIFGVAADLGDPAMERQFLRILVGGGYRILHVHSLLRWNTLMPALLAKAVGVRVVVSLHDLSPLCPNYLMLPRDAERDCGKPRAGVDRGCIDCLAPYRSVSLGATVPDPQTHLDARWHVWRRTLEAADVIVAPSRYLIDRIAEGFGKAIADRIVCIPHGLAAPPVFLPRATDQPLRVGFLFGENRGKGSARLLAIADQLLDRSMRFVVHAVHDRSALPASLPANLEWHGAYAPEQLPEILAGLDVVLMPTIVGETYSLALSECRAAGVVVLASRQGAFIERIRDGFDGWLLSVDRTDDWVARLRWLDGSDGRAVLPEIARNAAATATPGFEANAERYLDIYRQLVRTAAQPGTAVMRLPLRDVASRRLAEAVSGGALEPERARSGQPRPSTGTSSLRLGVIVHVRPGNRDRLDATLDSLRIFAPHCDIEVQDEALAVASSPMRRSVDTWHVSLDAGDRLDPETLYWLERCASSDAVAIRADMDHLDGSGRRHAAVAMASWDPWRALVDTGHGEVLFVRGDALERAGGWLAPGAVARYAMQLAIAQEGQAVATAGRVLIHRDDVNLSPAQAETVWRACVEVLRNALGPGWSLHTTGLLPGWTCRPALQGMPRVVIVAWNEHGIGHVEVEALRRAMDWPALVVIAAKPGLTLPDCDVVGFWRSDVGGLDRDAMGCLLAWLQQPSVVAVAPCRYRPNGGDRALGIAVDDAVPARLDGGGSTLVAVSRIPAASTSAMLVRRECLDDAALQLLAATDSANSARIQLEWQHGDAADVLLIGDVRVTQDLVDGPLDRPDPAAAERLDLAWRALPMGRRRNLCQRPSARAGASLAGLPKRGPRIAALTRDDWASSQYRVHLPLADLHRNGLIDVPLTWRLRHEAVPGLHQLEIEQPDMLIAHHAFDDASLRLLEQVARTMRIPIVLVVDDRIDAVPLDNPMRQRMPADMGRRLHQAIELSSCLVVTSDPLAEAYGKRAWRCQVIGNALPMEDWSALPRPPTRSGGRLRVGWAGAQQHGADLALISHLPAERPDLQWVFLGMAPEGAQGHGAEIHPMSSFADYPARLAALDLDLALVPLVDNPFNRAKSMLKLLEFGALGVPVIASDIDPYRAAPVLACGPHAQAWRDALQTMTSDASLRSSSAARLQAWVRLHHGFDQRRDAWCEALAISPSVPGIGEPRP